MATGGLWGTILVLLLSQQCFDASFLPESYYSGYNKIDYDAYIQDHVGGGSASVVEATDSDYSFHSSSNSKPMTNKIEMFPTGTVYKVDSGRPLLVSEGVPQFHPYKSYQYTTSNSLPLDNFKDLRVPPAATSSVSNSYEVLIKPASLEHPTIPKLDYSSSFKEPVGYDYHPCHSSSAVNLLNDHQYESLASSSINLPSLSLKKDINIDYSSDSIGSRNYLSDYSSSISDYSPSYASLKIPSYSPPNYDYSSLSDHSYSHPALNLKKDYNIEYSSPVLSSKTSESTNKISLDNHYDVASKSPIINTAAGSNFLAPYKGYSYTKVDSIQSEASNLDVPSASYSSISNSYAPSLSAAQLNHPNIPKLDISSSYQDLSSLGSHSHLSDYSSSISDYSPSYISSLKTPSYSPSHYDYSNINDHYSHPALNLKKDIKIDYASPVLSSKTSESSNKISLNNHYDVASKAPLINTDSSLNFMAPYKGYSYTKVDSIQSEASNLDVPSASYSAISNSYAPSLSSAQLNHPNIPKLDISSSYQDLSSLGSHSHLSDYSSSISDYSSNYASLKIPSYSPPNYDYSSLSDHSYSHPALNLKKDIKIDYASPVLSSKTSESTNKISLDNHYDVASKSPIINTAAGSNFLAPYKGYSYTKVDSIQSEASNLDVPSASYSSISNSYAPSLSSAQLNHPNIPKLDISSSYKDLSSIGSHSHLSDYSSSISDYSPSYISSLKTPSYSPSHYDYSSLSDHSYSHPALNLKKDIKIDYASPVLSSKTSESTNKISLNNHYDVASKAPLINTDSSLNFMAPYKGYSYTKVDSIQTEANNLDVPSASYSAISNSYAPSLSSAQLYHPSIPKLDISSSYKDSSSIGSHSHLSDYSPSYSGSSMLDSSLILSSLKSPSYSAPNYDYSSLSDHSYSHPALNIKKDINIAYASPVLSSKTSESTNKINLDNHYDVASKSPIINTAAGSNFLAPYKGYSYTKVDSIQSEASNLDVPSASYSSISNSYSPSLSAASLSIPNIPHLDISSSIAETPSYDFHHFVPNYNEMISTESYTSKSNYKLPNYKAYASSSDSSSLQLSGDQIRQISLDNSYDSSLLSGIQKSISGQSAKDYSYSSNYSPSSHFDFLTGHTSSAGSSETINKISLNNNYDVASKAPLINIDSSLNYLAPYKGYSYNKVQSIQSDATSMNVPSASYSSISNAYVPSTSSAYLTHSNIPHLDISSSYKPSLDSMDLSHSGLFHYARPLIDHTDAIIGYECPSGFKLVGNKCYEVIVQDASPIKMKHHG